MSSNIAETKAREKPSLIGFVSVFTGAALLPTIVSLLSISAAILVQPIAFHLLHLKLLDHEKHDYSNAPTIRNTIAILVVPLLSLGLAFAISIFGLYFMGENCGDGHGVCRMLFYSVTIFSIGIFLTAAFYFYVPGSQSRPLGPKPISFAKLLLIWLAIAAINLIYSFAASGHGVLTFYFFVVALSIFATDAYRAYLTEIRKGEC